jgi:hypothetical protein
MINTTSFVRVVGFVALGALVACGPTLSEVRMGMFPANAPNCALQLVQVTPADMQPGGRLAEYQQVGMVSVSASAGTDPMSEEIRGLVRPRACAMGGEMIGLQMSGQSMGYMGSARTALAYSVWRHRAAPSNAPPQAF